ncbi:PaaI family thioesterase [Rhodococcus tukisamuensis]|uniref:Acyl-coenzyme A thioesterase THEM4 n=1 Tax=Rhodococcus tukisamuensis TaxID=168276 RepID=A0A1G7DKV9_9NOCA|nr:PaaI family thioesterase [Rhodococcus tukisamuensis]SDE51395.1 Thioesterase superfamily protein [Rhodococcus tukisamuensis]
MTESIARQQSLYVQDGLSDEEIDRQSELYGPLTDSVRDLIEIALLTEVEDEVDLRAAQEHLEAAKQILRKRMNPGPYGVRWGASGQKRAWGNAAAGLRNAVAPPVVLQHDPDGRAWCDFHLGSQYEGPAGLTHGGVSALILDQVLGSAAEFGGAPGMTGTLTLRYRRPTPLGALHAEARIDRIEGVKTIVVGHLAAADGVCVEAEGVFILPKWARSPGPSTIGEPAPDGF